ncbi:MAG: succinate dehydrogenase iron-sulfur subunit [Desulfobacterales bacterium]|nr:succinate dehydrogenase iron-sulfur subunit [Desulfobacterales bacterium]MDJ0914144.1 succinate dehydrogenase iron-sulfur subunit [Desulfobacterales bacterium]
MRCTFIIHRYDPAADTEPRYQEYSVDAEPTDKILDCLNKIRWEQDPTLTYRYSCAHGICGSDALMINGRIELACQKLVRDFKTGYNFVIEPLPLFNVIKDLIVDLNPFFNKHRYVRPYLITDEDMPTTEWLQTRENQEFVEPALRCILCASCTSACPINRANGNYLGPAALLRSFRYIFDSRDTATGSRLAQMDSEDGVWGCRSMWWCTDVCPKEIPVTKCLAQIKRLIKQEAKK